MTKFDDALANDHVIIIDVSRHDVERPFKLASQPLASGEIERQAAVEALARRAEEEREAAQQEWERNETLRLEAEGSQEAAWKAAAEAAGFGATH